MLQSFLQELRRRRVLRGAALYGAIAFTVLQGIDIIIEPLRLPEWLLTLAVILAIIGLPIALVVTWMYDLTPAGLQRTAEPAAQAEPVVVARRPLFVVAYIGIGALAAFLGLAAYVAVRPATDPMGSIAVLPFRALDDNSGEDEYFADGITEELINALVNVPGMRVAARSAVLPFKGTDWVLADVGEKLGVNAVLEGSVRRAAGSLLLTVRLVNVKTGYSLWSERFQRDARDVFQVQEDIARVVANRVANRDSTVADPLVRQSTENADAYELFLKGRYHWNLRTPDGMSKAIDFYKQALALDPTYGLAYAGLADALIGLAGFGYLPAQQVMPQAEFAAQRAVDVDPWLGEAHASLAHVAEFWNYDWEKAEHHNDRAVELSPKSIDAHAWRGQFLVHAGRFEQGLTVIRYAVDLDPLHIPTRFVLAMALFNARRFDDAILESRSIVQMVPTYFPAAIYLALSLAERQRFDESIATLDALGPALNALPATEGARGYVLGRAGRMEEARASLARLEAMSKERYVGGQSLAAAYSGMGDSERAMDALLHAHEQRWPLMHAARIAPFLDAARASPRYAAFAKELGFID